MSSPNKTKETNQYKPHPNTKVKQREHAFSLEQARGTHDSNQSQLIAEAQWRQTIRQSHSSLLYEFFSPSCRIGNLSFLYYCNKTKPRNCFRKKDGEEGEESRRRWRTHMPCLRDMVLHGSEPEEAANCLCGMCMRRKRVCADLFGCVRVVILIVCTQ